MLRADAGPGERRVSFRAGHGHDPGATAGWATTVQAADGHRGQALLVWAIRAHLRRHDITAFVPSPADQIAHHKRRGSAGGRPPTFDRTTYRRRNTVERCINQLKQWRGLATRYDKKATVYLAAFHIAGIFIWSRE